MIENGTVYRANITSVTDNGAYVEVPSLATDYEFGPCEIPAGVSLEVGDRVAVGSIGNIEEDFVILAKIGATMEAALGTLTTFFQSTVPTATAAGDLWYDSDDYNHMYRASVVGANVIADGQWVSMRDATIAESASDAADALAAAQAAQTAAENAQATADGKVTTYYDSDAPTDASEGDLWFDTDDNTVWRLDNVGNWVTVRDLGIAEALQQAMNAQTTADGKITAYYETEKPTTGLLGDLWYDIDDQNRPYYCSSENPLTWTPVRDGKIQDALDAAAAADAKAVAAQTDADEAIANASTAQATADGKVRSFFEDTPPAGMTSSDIGDMWFDTNDGNKLYRWDGDSWELAQDQDIVSAINKADLAQETADGKVTTFYQITPPVSEGIGDLWVDTDDQNHLYRAESIGASTVAAGQWVSVRDKTIAAVSSAASAAQTAANEALNAAQAAQATADGAIRTYYDAEPPWADGSAQPEANLGDMWFDTDTNQAYRWNGTSWQFIQDNTIATALAAAQNAQTTADGKITAYYENAAPATAEAGDLWYDTDAGNKPHYWDGDSWEPLPIGSAAIADNAVTMAKLGADAEGAIYGSIKSYVTEYAVSPSETVAPTTGWSTATPTRTPGTFIWYRVTLTYNSGDTNATSPALLTGNTGAQGSQGIQGPKGADGSSLFTWLKYADTPSSGMSDDPTGKTYIGLAYNKTSATESSTYTDYTWSLIKGETGAQGIQGPAGADGQPTFTWIKYATSAAGANLSDDPTGRTYIGIAYNKTTATESTDPDDYAWSLIQGPQGVQGPQGIQGPSGENGESLYTWLKYADTPTTGMADTPVGKTYMGIAYNKTTATESSNYADYQWSLIQGPQGTAGKGVSSTSVTYQTGNSGTVEPAGAWSPGPTATTPGQFLWTKTVTTYTDGSNSTAYSVAAHGTTGATGSTGATGRGVSGTSVTYQVHSNGTTAPTGSWLTNVPATSPGQYLWTRTVTTYSDNLNPTTAYAVAAHGATGAQGIQGPAGVDGQPTFTWIKYGTSSTGAGISDDPTGKTYIGIAYNKTTQTESSTPGDYTWSLIQGPQGLQGPQGIQGPSGANGESLFTWIKYADTPTTGMADTPTGKTYMGIAYNKPTATESSNYSDYSWSLIQGPQGATGKGISTTSITYQTGSSGTTAPTGTWSANPTTTTTGQYLWTKTYTTYTDGTNSTAYSVAAHGTTGSTGSTGAAGRGISGTAVTYQVGTSGTTAPTGAWLTTIPTTSPGQYLWTRTITSYTDGLNPTTAYAVAAHGATGSQGVQGPAGANGQPTYTWIKYGTSSNGAGISDDPTGKTYIGIAYNKLTQTESSTATDYTWSLIQGPQGTQGPQGVQGPSGANGESLFTWIKYADTPTTGMSDTPAGKTYMGIAYNKTSATESSTYSDYSWSLIKGPQGDTGKGISSTSVTYQTANSGTVTPTGTWSANPTATSPGQYLWTRTITTYTDANTSTAYAVAAHGSTGATGAAGRGVSGTTVTYQVHNNGTVAPTGTWLTTIPATSPGQYLWTRTITTYSDGLNPTTAYAVAAHGATGSQGVQGPAGSDGQPTYTWIKYGTSSTGAGMSDDPAGKTYIGIAYNKLTQAESSDPDDYQWSLIQGPQGNTGSTGATGATGISVSSITPYYRTVTAGAATPAAPTTSPPAAPWTATEPAYVANTDLYRTERIVFSNATFAYSTVVKSSAYEAAKQAKITADQAISGLNDANTAIDGKASTYFQNDPPWANGATGHAVDQNDIWIDTNDSNKMYRWNDATKTWVLSQDQSIAAEMKAYVQSRGENLVTNGTGLLKSNDNFTGATFTASDAPEGMSGSFIFPSGYRTSFADEVIPVDPNQRYEFTSYVRQVAGPSSTSKFYMMLVPLDAYGAGITPAYYMYRDGTTTTLAAPLNVGDTTIQLTSAANWANAVGSASHWRNIIWWDYVDPGGKAWPEHTYSRNVMGNAYADGGINFTTNVITLRVPYAGPAKPAGTKVSNGGSGGTYMYLVSLANVTEEWTKYTGRSEPGIHNIPLGSATTKFPPGTAATKIGWLLNAPSPGTGYQQSVAGVSLTDVTLASEAQATADRKVTTYYQNEPPTAEAKGDLWVDTNDSNKLYRAFAANVNWIGTTGWVLVQDSAGALNVANSKTKTFSQSTTPSATTIGDLWIHTGEGNKMYRATAVGTGGWVPHAIGANAIAATARQLGSITTHTGATDPAASAIEGDMWLKPETVAGPNGNVTVQTLHRRTSGAWVRVEDPSVQQALINAANAADQADGKSRIWVQATAPTGLTADDDGDIWFDTDSSPAFNMHRWVWGTTTGSWQQFMDASTALAQLVATTAYSTANAKNKVTYSPDLPGTATNAAGDVWFQRDTEDGTIISQWEGQGGTSWIKREMGHQTIASIDLGKGVFGQLTGDNIDTTFLKSGFTLTSTLEVLGTISVGDSKWTKDVGLVFPDRLMIPSDPAKPADIKGRFRAVSLTVESDMTIQGTKNIVQGELKLANGVTDPNVPPSVYHSWPFIQTAEGQTFGPIHYGVTSHHSDANLLVTAVVLYGTSVRSVSKVNGAGYLLHNAKPWTSTGPVGYNATGGIVRIGSFYYLFGQDSARTYTPTGIPWYIYKLDTNFDKVGEYLVVQPAGSGRPTIGTDGTNVLVAFPQTDSVLVHTVPTTLASGTTRTITGLDNLVGTPLSHIGIGNYDFGTQKTVISVAGIANFVFAGNGSTGNREGDVNAFGPANAGEVRGLHWDGTRFLSFDKDGKLHQHGRLRNNTSATFSYSFYDGNATGGTHETKASTPATFTIPARAWYNIQATQTPPDSGVAAAHNDWANRVGFYAAIGAASRRLQVHGGLNGLEAVMLYTSDLITANLAVEKASNEFNTSILTRPGSVVSTAVDVQNRPKFEVKGDGSGRWDAVRPPGEMTMFAGTTAPDGWLLCHGQALSTTTYKALFDAIGYAFGGSGTSFNLPDMRGRTPVGVGTATGAAGATNHTLGQKSGEETHLLTAAESGLPAHNHSVSSFNAFVVATTVPGTVGSNGVAGLTGTSTAQNATSRHNLMQPYVGLNYIIKT